MDPPLLRQMVTRGEDKVQPKLSAEAFLVFPKYLCTSVHSQQTHNGTCHKTVNVTLIWGTTLRLDCCGLFHKNAVWSVGCRRSIFHAAYWNSEYSQIFFLKVFFHVFQCYALGSQKKFCGYKQNQSPENWCSKKSENLRSFNQNSQMKKRPSKRSIFCLCTHLWPFCSLFTNIAWPSYRTLPLLPRLHLAV